MCKRKNIKPPVYLDTIEDKGGFFLVRLKGSLDMDVLAGNRDKMTAVSKEMNLDTKNILIDFENVTHTDSSTVAALLGRFLDIQKVKKRIALFNVPEEFRKLIEILRVEHNFLIYDKELTALREFR
tara:strand:- start:501 stop:878 length:378 start_codon:yes stop_codon:yes gene_type:complete